MAIPTHRDPQFKLRIPADLKQRIEESAAQNSRSTTAEIIAALEAVYPPTDTIDAAVDLLTKVIMLKGALASPTNTTEEVEMGRKYLEKCRAELLEIIDREPPVEKLQSVFGSLMDKR